MLIRTSLSTLAVLTGITAAPRLDDTPRVRPVSDEVLPAPSQPPLGAVFTCYRRAHDETRLDDTSVAALCQGAVDASPVDCYRGARNQTPLGIEEAIALCRCAPSTAPVDCVEVGRSSTRLDTGRILALCAPVERFDLDETCSPPRR